jgi:hypothetical protein
MTLVIFSWLKQWLNSPIMHVCCLYCLLECILQKRMTSFGPELARKWHFCVIDHVACSFFAWHDIMMGPSFIPLLSNIDIKCHKLLCS